MSETYSFISLRELIDAKLARRIELLAELDKIDNELLEGRARIADLKLRGREAVPTLPVSLESIPVVPVMRDSIKVRLCKRCPNSFVVKSPSGRMCEACRSASFKARAMLIGEKNKKRRVGLVEEVDRRIAHGT